METIEPNIRVDVNWPVDVVADDPESGEVLNRLTSSSGRRVGSNLGNHLLKECSNFVMSYKFEISTALISKSRHFVILVVTNASRQKSQFGLEGFTFLGRKTDSLKPDMVLLEIGSQLRWLERKEAKRGHIGEQGPRT